MSAPDRFIAWCKQRASIQQQLELIVKHPSRGGARAAWRPIKKSPAENWGWKEEGPGRFSVRRRPGIHIARIQNADCFVAAWLTPYRP